MKDTEILQNLYIKLKNISYTISLKLNHDTFYGHRHTPKHKQRGMSKKTENAVKCSKKFQHMHCNQYSAYRKNVATSSSARYIVPSASLWAGVANMLLFPSFGWSSEYAVAEQHTATAVTHSDWTMHTHQCTSHNADKQRNQISINFILFYINTATHTSHTISCTFSVHHNIIS